MLYSKLFLILTLCAVLLFDLYYYCAGGNALTGTIPSEIGFLTSLTTLDICKLEHLTKILNKYTKLHKRRLLLVLTLCVFFSCLIYIFHLQLLMSWPVLFQVKSECWQGWRPFLLVSYKYVVLPSKILIKWARYQTQIVLYSYFFCSSFVWLWLLFYRY